MLQRVLVASASGASERQQCSSEPTVFYSKLLHCHVSRKPAAIQRLAFKMREEIEKRLMKLEEQEQRAYLHAELGIKPQES